MIEIGCQTYSLRRLGVAEMLVSVRKAGFRTVELWTGHAGTGANGDTPAAVRAAAGEIGIAIRAYSAGGFVGRGLPAVEEGLEAAFAYARGLGTDLVTGVIDRRALPIVERLCRRTGVRFGIENHWYAEFARTEDYVSALAGVDSLVGVTLDTGHLTAAGESPAVAFRQLGARVFDIHLKDVRLPGRLARWFGRRPRMECQAIGAGQARLDALLAALAASDYRGCLMIEDERPALPLADLHQALRVCRTLLRNAAPCQEFVG